MAHFDHGAVLRSVSDRAHCGGVGEVDTGSRPHQPSDKGVARMFGLFNGIKYRNEVITQLHAILMLVPRLKSLTSPLKDATNEYRKENTPEMEAAVWLSLVVIENLMVSVPPDTRLLTLRYLNEKTDDNFRWFANYAQAVTANQKPEHSEDMPNLAAVLGFAFWHLVVAVQQNKLSENVFRTFIHEVVGMLRQNERDREQPN